MFGALEILRFTWFFWKAFMLRLTVDSGSYRVYLSKLEQIPADMPKVLDGIGQMLESRISARFETQKDPMGAKWAALKPSTLKSYPKDGNRKVLNRHGDMMRSLNHYLQDNGNAVVVGFGQPYAVFHEHSTKNMARRGLLFGDPNAGTLSPGDEAAVLDALNRYLMDI